MGAQRGQVAGQTHRLGDTAWWLCAVQGYVRFDNHPSYPYSRAPVMVPLFLLFLVFRTVTMRWTKRRVRCPCFLNDDTEAQRGQ